jgi:dihydropyrimidinase
MPHNLIIRNATIFISGQLAQKEIRISDGKIIEIENKIKKRTQGHQDFDADGLLVLPGGIDPHVHLTLPASVPPGERWVDDFITGSRAALAGGITTVGNISFPEFGESPLETIYRESQTVREQTIVDVMLHPVITYPSRAVLQEIPYMAEQGNTSIKIFMVDRMFEQYYPDYLEIMRIAGQSGIISMIHCEDYSIISQATNKLVSEGKSSLHYYAESRPVESEVLATQRAIEMCEMSGAPIYVVHLSSQQALQVCEQAYNRSLPVYVETRPLYLHFTQERYHQSDGPLFIGQPPLRTTEDVNYLWDGLAEGFIHTIGTDHAPWTREQKMDPSHDLTNLRPGVNNLQVMLPLLYSEGVVKNRISVGQFVSLTSTNPAKLFGLYPQKGTIEIGSDADLVLWDKQLTRVIQGEDMFSRAGFSIYEGMEVTGWPIITIRRGEVVYQKGQITAKPGSGRILKRSKFRPL